MSTGSVGLRSEGDQGRRPDRAVVRGADVGPVARWTDHGLTSVQHPQQMPPTSPADVGHQQQRVRLLDVPAVRPRQVLGDQQRVRPDQGQHAVHLGGGEQHRRQRPRWRPLRSFGRRGQHLLSGSGQEPLPEALAVALPDPSAGVELVVVARHAGGGQLVDVAEQQLGELGHRRRRQSRLGGVPGQPPPAHSGPDPVGRQQRIHRAPGPGLAAPQGVRTLERRASRRAGVDVTGAAGQLEEAADGHLDGGLDALAHGTAEADPVVWHLCHHRRDRLRRDGRQPFP